MKATLNKDIYDTAGEQIAKAFNDRAHILKGIELLLRMRINTLVYHGIEELRLQSIAESDSELLRLMPIELSGYFTSHVRPVNVVDREREGKCKYIV